MADNRFQPPPRKKNALDNRKLNLSAPCPTAPGKTSSLIWGLYSNNPRITVYTGDPEDSGERNGYGRIQANLDGPVLFQFFELAKEIIAGPANKKAKVENLNFTFFGGKRSESPVVISELWVGKDNEGIVWLSVTADNRPKIKFPINNNTFHNLYHGDGTPVTKDESSVLWAKGYITLLSNVYGHLMVTEYTEPPPPKQQGNGGGQNRPGYNNNNSGGGGGYNSNSQRESITNDIPF